MDENEALPSSQNKLKEDCQQQPQNGREDSNF